MDAVPGLFESGLRLCCLRRRRRVCRTVMGQFCTDTLIDLHVLTEKTVYPAAAAASMFEYPGAKSQYFLSNPKPWVSSCTEVLLIAPSLGQYMAALIVYVPLGCLLVS